MLLKAGITSTANTNAIHEKIRYMLSEEDKLKQSFFYTSFNQNQKYKEKRKSFANIVLFRTLLLFQTFIVHSIYLNI